MYDDRRKSLNIERGSGLVVTQDYLKRRMNKAEFELCPDCPATQSQFQSKYRVTCKAHNKNSSKIKIKIRPNYFFLKHKRLKSIDLSCLDGALGF